MKEAAIKTVRGTARLDVADGVAKNLADFPFLVAVAPVDAPRTWPKSSDSSSDS